MLICLKRAYDPPEDNDGLRILVDRLWPRGISKEKLRLDGWEKALAPSSTLRTWFAHEPDKWEAFRHFYLDELNGRGEEATNLLSRAEHSRLTLIYAARDARHNHAIVLKEFLEKMDKDRNK
ncbi:DUF488 domain-containing protein [Geopsychrobacter electrodiphilus]|uniref:DUF488 domain-containing protein n=1 Tax=Geopsychrobacter electrodiphilus TaxID=225196 RepID=UPI0003735B84|nr:DUF488 family protein [Geopsychrobacter electrodiphilus]